MLFLAIPIPATFAECHAYYFSSTIDGYAENDSKFHEPIQPGKGWPQMQTITRIEPAYGDALICFEKHIAKKTRITRLLLQCIINQGFCGVEILFFSGL